MSERLSIVIPSDLNDEIERLQKILKMDKSTVIRHLLSKSIQEVKIETALDEYKRGKVSFGKAAEIAGINLWEFIDVCHSQKINLELTEEDVEIGINRVLKLDIEKYKQKSSKSLETTKE